MKYIDLRSDTVTDPTEQMRQAMIQAVVGDDVYDDDPTTNELQEFAAKLMGKEAAIFVPSGTFGNQVCILAHTNAGEEVIVDDDAHIIQHEAGAAGVISGVQFRTFETENGRFTENVIKGIRRRVRPGTDIHWPRTALICLENARSDGKVVSVEEMKAVREISREFNIPLHIDGARIFNAAAHLNIEVGELSELYDSMTFCLSKGLCAPSGSIVVGSREFIDRVKFKRKILGGGMRQTGFLAAAGLIALKDMTKRLNKDNENAIYLRNKLKEVRGVCVLPEEDVQISMVFFKFDGDSEALACELLKEGIKINTADGGVMRFVTHYWITKENIDFVIEKMKKFMN